MTNRERMRRRNKIFNIVLTSIVAIFFIGLWVMFKDILVAIGVFMFTGFLLASMG